MTVIVARPPNFELILGAFPDAWRPGVIFAYGNDIYNPSGKAIPSALAAHEAVHQSRQTSEGPELWWKRYIAEPEFRYREELLAHVAEFKARDNGDRNWRAKLLYATALRLVAPLYNYQPPRTLVEAARDIREELDK